MVPSPRSPLAQARSGSISLETGLALLLCLWAVLGSAAFLGLDRESRLELQRLERQGRTEVELPAFRRDLLEPPPLVVLISVDTLRADRLDLYGYERETAPNLRRLGEQGLVFETVSSQSSQTLTSHKSIFTGKYPARLIAEVTGTQGDTEAAQEDPRRFLIETFAAAPTTLATSMQRAGYRTAAFTDGGWMTRELSFDRGFNEFDQRAGGFRGVLPRATRWLEQETSGRTFVFVHGYDVHCPYTSEPEFDDRFCPDHGRHLDLDGRCGKGQMSVGSLDSEDYRGVSDHYDAGIASADAHLGRFFEELRRQGRYEEALIVVLSDHGESLGERPHIGHGGLYPEQLRVPLVIKPPTSWGVAPARFNQPVELVDVLPTLLEAAGAPPLACDGQSVLALAADLPWPRKLLQAQTTFEDALEGSSSRKRAVHSPDRWHVVHTPGEAEALYFDFEEAGGLLEPRTVPGEEIRALFERLLPVRPPTAHGEGGLDGAKLRGVQLPEDLETRLRDLGYGG